MGQVAQIKADRAHTSLLDSDGVTVEMNHAVRLLLWKLVEPACASITGAQDFKKALLPEQRHGATGFTCLPTQTMD